MQFKAPSIVAGLWKFGSLKKSPCLEGFFICDGQTDFSPAWRCLQGTQKCLPPPLQEGQWLPAGYTVTGICEFSSSNSVLVLALHCRGRFMNLIQCLHPSGIDSRIASELQFGNEFNAEWMNSCLLILLNQNLRMQQVELFLKLLGWLWKKASQSSANIFSSIWLWLN